jgi:2-polyprenyl-6-methoxyphenol hydroxylase-like FAD-dependent oxidoreductase
MPSPVEHSRYDVVVAGARCAGAATAMLLARRGLSVLAVDPARYGSDTLSTHALMRGAVLQLHRWGLLERICASGAPPIRSTSFHYGSETIEIPIKAKGGVDALRAPRRTVLDAVLDDGARAAGAEVAHGVSVVGLIHDGDGRVRGARIAGADREAADLSADLVIGADGIHSRVARLVDAPIDYQAPHAATSIYGHWKDIPFRDYHWFYEVGASVGTIPTNDGATCVFVLVPQARFDQRRDGLDSLYREVLTEVSAELAAAVATSQPVKLRAFRGQPGYLRRACGPGWALVGDAGYFRDPITAHGISDALREAELLARAVADRGDEGLKGYQEQRDQRVRGFLDVTDRLASFAWDLETAKAEHLVLSREMNAQVQHLTAPDAGDAAAVAAPP